MPESPALPTAYEVLGVSASADQDQVRRAYRRLLRETHPDTGGSAARFHAVQHAWDRLRDPSDRAAYDRGKGVPVSAADAGSPASAGQARPRCGQGRSSPRARCYGRPGRHARERFLTAIQEWADGEGLRGDPYDPALVRAAPRAIRQHLAKALAEESTARTVSGLGIGYTSWNEVATATPEYSIDHVVLGPAGLFAIRSEDWGGEIRLVKAEIVGDALASGEQPIHSLVRSTRRLARSLGVRFTAFAIVVPDEALAEPALPVEHGSHVGSVLIRRSLVPHLLRTGLRGMQGRGTGPIGTARISVGDAFEVRTRLQNGIRVTP